MINIIGKAAYDVMKAAGVNGTSIDRRYPVETNFSEDGKTSTLKYRTMDGRNITMHGKAIVPQSYGAPSCYIYSVK